MRYFQSLASVDPTMSLNISSRLDDFSSLARMSSMQESENDQNIQMSPESLLAHLQGRKVTIHNLRTIFRGWAEGRNPHYEHMIPLVDQRLET